MKKSSIIKQIAQELDSGFDCYYNSQTNEIIAIPNFSQFSDAEDFRDNFQAELEKVKNHQKDFIKFEVLDSFESFKIMEQFVAQLSDNYFQSQLKNALLKKKPFQNFKQLIDHSDFRQSWFDFKQHELERLVASKMNL